MKLIFLSKAAADPCRERLSCSYHIYRTFRSPAQGCWLRMLVMDSASNVIMMRHTHIATYLNSFPVESVDFGGSLESTDARFFLVKSYSVKR